MAIVSVTFSGTTATVKDSAASSAAVYMFLVKANDPDVVLAKQVAAYNPTTRVWSADLTNAQITTGNTFVAYSVVVSGGTMDVDAEEATYP
jgi:hypothetical protein